ncbi:MAG: transporter substrate-binding domain-containing protein [Bacteriovoracaceae bacterium]|nr:transporter substrate-binding domain-containing protein [Bacteriovoracaceae bacterium]
MQEIDFIKQNKFLSYLLFFSFLTFSCLNVQASSIKKIKCAIATGYPPYQYLENGVPSGIDSQLIALINKYNQKMKIEIHPMLWADAMATLSYTNKLDCIFGMEINDTRKKRFLFTRPVYSRESSLFVLASSSFKNLESLSDQKISSDEESELHRELSSFKKYRLIKVDTKEDAFLKLVSGKTAAAIFPERIGRYFSQKSKIELRIVRKAKSSTGVAIAVKTIELQNEMNQILNKLPQSEIQKILNNF